MPVCPRLETGAWTLSEPSGGGGPARRACLCSPFWAGGGCFRALRDGPSFAGPIGYGRRASCCASAGGPGRPQPAVVVAQPLLADATHHLNPPGLGAP